MTYFLSFFRHFLLVIFIYLCILQAMFFLRRCFFFFCIFVVSFSQTAFGFQFFGIDTVDATSPQTKKNLVAIFVDQSIYGAIKGDLDRYTNTYIPKPLSCGTGKATIEI